MHNTGGQVRSSPAIGPDGTIYFGSGVSVYALNYADGSLWWKRWLGFTASSESSPAVGADHTVYVGADDGNLYALNPSDGSVKWSHYLHAAVKSSPAIGPDGTVYVGCESDSLLAFGTTGPSVRGSVTCDGAPLQGALLTLMPIAQSAVTGSDGSYAVTDVPSGTYTLTPSKWGYTFSPPNMLVRVSTDDVIDRNFAASPAPTHVVSGSVAFGGDPLPGVSIMFSPGGLQVWTLSDGTYSANVQSGIYTLTPSKAGYAFTPTQQTVIVSGEDVPGKDFSATATVTYSVSGTVTLTGNPLEGIPMMMTPGGYASTTGADGTYTIVGVSDGRTYVIVPVSNDYWFAPPSRQFTMNSADVTGMDFAATSFVWPKFHHDAGNTGLSTTVGAQTGALKWAFATGSVVNSSPAIGADGTIYVGAANGLYALNPADGTQKWKITSSTACSPALGADGRLYSNASSALGVSAINPADGSIIWSSGITANAGFPTGSVALGGDGTIYFTAGSGTAYRLYALNPGDGSVKWSFLSDSQLTSCPAIGADGTVYIAGLNYYIYALSPLDGSIKWSYRAKAAVYSSPAIAADGTVYVGSDDYWLYALNPADGSLKWRGAGVGVIRSSPAIGPDGTIYVATWHFAGTLSAIDPADGSVKWEYLTTLRPDSSPAVDAAGSVYFGADNAFVYSLNADGTKKWSYKTGAAVKSSPAIGADGMVYVCGGDGGVYAFSP
jgi:outer membrane protein assembly factor BamB